MWQLCVVEDCPTHDDGVPDEKQWVRDFTRSVASAACVLQTGRLRAHLGGLTEPWPGAHISREKATTRTLVRLEFLISGTTSPLLGLLRFLLYAVKIPQGV